MWSAQQVDLEVLEGTQRQLEIDSKIQVWSQIAIENLHAFFAFPLIFAKRSRDAQVQMRIDRSILLPRPVAPALGPYGALGDFGEGFQILGGGRGFSPQHSAFAALAAGALIHA